MLINSGGIWTMGGDIGRRVICVMSIASIFLGPRWGDASIAYSGLDAGIRAAFKPLPGASREPPWQSPFPAAGTTLDGLEDRGG